MKLSARARFGLRASVELAHLGAWKKKTRAGGAGDMTVPLSDIAKSQSVDVMYLRQIMAGLKKSGLVLARQGRSGGYQLARSPRRISALEVLRAVDEDLGFVRCIKRPSHCKRSKSCRTRPLWVKLASDMTSTLSHTSVAQLAEEGMADVVT